MKHWYEVHRCINGKHDAIVTTHRTKKQAEKAVKEAIDTGLYECVYFEYYGEDGIIDPI